MLLLLLSAVYDLHIAHTSLSKQEAHKILTLSAKVAVGCSYHIPLNGMAMSHCTLTLYMHDNLCHLYLICSACIIISYEDSLFPLYSLTFEKKKLNISAAYRYSFSQSYYQILWFSHHWWSYTRLITWPWPTTDAGRVRLV